MIFLEPNRNSTHCMHMPKQASQLLFAYLLPVRYGIEITSTLGFKRWISRTICDTLDRAKYYVFLICSQEKCLHSQEKYQEKEGKCSAACVLTLKYNAL